MSGPGLNLPKDDPRYRALSLVRAPAFLLLCVGTLNIVLCLLLLVFAGLMAAGVVTLSPERAAALKDFSLASFLLPAVAAIICGVAVTSDMSHLPNPTAQLLERIVSRSGRTS